MICNDKKMEDVKSIIVTFKMEVAILTGYFAILKLKMTSDYFG